MTNTLTTWPTRRLAECGEWVSGGTPSKADASYWNGSIPWISAKSLKCFDLNDSEDRITQEAVENGPALVPAGTVLFVVRLTEELLRSSFLEMFGDPATNPKGWQRVQLGNVVRTGLRNGVSPSTDGTVSGQVLILSAITGREFDPDQVKDGRFMTSFESGQLVSPDDFLICRGNGNRSLVGCGRFPVAPMPGTVFPDTMIAARIDFSRINRLFFEHLWASKCVRQQIEKGARTTNGTYKVNQQVLGAIEFPLPPLGEQELFARIASKLGVAARQSALQLSESLFGSLVQRAFRGEL